MDQTLTTLRRRIKKTKADARGHRRYEEGLRIAVVEYALDRGEDGDSLAAVARELGLTQRTLWGWVQRNRESVIRPVELVDESLDPAPSTRSLVLPGGSRIEGLSLEDIVALVRALS